MIIREYKETDQSAVTELLVQLQSHLVSIDNECVQILLDEYRREYLSRLLTNISQNSGKLFVAENDDSLLGMVAGIIEPKDEEDKLTNRCPIRGKVLELVVSEKMRSNGVGAALLKTMEFYFETQNCEFISVDVFVPNAGAVQFYEQNSYVPRNIEMYKRIGENV